jgi:hypothetical protein
MASTAADKRHQVLLDDQVPIGSEIIYDLGELGDGEDTAARPRARYYEPSAFVGRRTQDTNVVVPVSRTVFSACSRMMQTLPKKKRYFDLLESENESFS